MQILLTGEPHQRRPRLRDRPGQRGGAGRPGWSQAAQALAERIAANAPLSVWPPSDRLAVAAHRLDDAYAEAERIWEPVYRSADAQEGPAAFRDKRPPVWTGR